MSTRALILCPPDRVSPLLHRSNTDIHVRPHGRFLDRVSPRGAPRLGAGGSMKRDEAALCDLLEVTRRVMLPAKDNGTFWCEGVNPLLMCEWALSVRAQS